MSTRWTMDDVKRFEAKKGIVSELPTSLINAKLPQFKNASFALGRMKGRKMNKTEAAYAKYLDILKQIGEVVEYWFEEINLRIADNCFYKPDFLVLLSNGHLEVHETKGFWQDDALVKIKAAAEKFPFRFIAVRLVKGNWEIREF